jgi:hypothetical protein
LLLTLFLLTRALNDFDVFEAYFETAAIRRLYFRQIIQHKGPNVK